MADDSPLPTRSEEIGRASRSVERTPVATTPEVTVDLTKATPQPLSEIAAARSAPVVVLPLAEGTFRVTSSYGQRSDPFNGSLAFHEGVDLAAPQDTPIHAVADGIVDYVGPGKDGRSSMIIVIAHEIDGEIVYSWYNHMYPDDLYVQVGEEVKAGEVIAGVGSNGRSTGPHLHFEIHTDDQLTTTDPLAWLQDQGAVDISSLR